MFETCLKKTEIIESIEFEIPKQSSYQKLPNPASRYAIVGVYVAKHKAGINVGITGAKPCVYNDKDLVNALSKNFSSSAIENVKISSSGMNSDIHASSEYRANMVKVFAKKAVEAC
jgi:carbon-monoxide dehydrogenase medium subunit